MKIAVITQPDLTPIRATKDLDWAHNFIMKHRKCKYFIIQLDEK